MKIAPTFAFLLATAALAQAPTMKQLMLDLIHPASNDLLLFVNRGGSQDEKDWAVVRRGAVTLEESGNLLLTPGYARDQGEWAKDAKLLAAAGSAAYTAAQAKDLAALAALADRIDAACTGCHKQYRPNVFPRTNGSTK
jgi:hypothetical protein